MFLGRIVVISFTLPSTKYQRFAKYGEIYQGMRTFSFRSQNSTNWSTIFTFPCHVFSFATYCFSTLISNVIWMWINRSDRWCLSFISFSASEAFPLIILYLSPLRCTIHCFWENMWIFYLSRSFHDVFFFIFLKLVDRYFWIILSFLSFFFNSFGILYHALWFDESFFIDHPDPAEFSRSRRCSGCLGRSSYARHLLSLRLPWCDPVRLFVHSPGNCHRSGPTQRKVQHSHWYEFIRLASFNSIICSQIPGWHSYSHLLDRDRNAESWQWKTMQRNAGHFNGNSPRSGKVWNLNSQILAFIHSKSGVKKRFYVL